MNDGRELEHILDKLSEDDILNFFKAYGAVEASRNNRHVWFNTFCHGGDSNKLCYNRDSKSFYCYTHCGYLSIFTLAQKVLKTTFGAVVQRFTEIIGEDRRHRLNIADWIDRKYIEDLERRAQMVDIEVPSVPFEFPHLDENVLNYFDNRTFYKGWIDEGIKVDVMEQFGIRWDELGTAVIIPHRDINGQLVGIRKRTVGAVTNKYTPVYLGERGYAHPLGMNLYGLYENSNTIKAIRKVVIFEGEKSVLKHSSMYGKSNAVAVCGSHISSMQRALLMHMGVEEATIAFDRDCDMCGEEGRYYTEKIAAIGRMLSPLMRTYAIFDYQTRTQLKDSPVDQGRDVYEQLMRERILITSG